MKGAAAVLLSLLGSAAGSSSTGARGGSSYTGFGPGYSAFDGIRTGVFEKG